MAIDAKTPLALYKANLELVLRLGTLLQENRRRWSQLGAVGSSAAIARSLAETERMLTSNDWKSVSAMPGADFWKSLRDETGTVQGSIDAAVGSQTAFAQGLQEAFAAWQQQSADALGSGNVLPVPAVFMDHMQSFTQRSGPGQPQAKAQAQPTPKPKLKTKPKPTTKPKLKTKPKPTTKPKPKPTPKPKPKAKPKPKPKVATASASRAAKRKKPSRK